MEIFIETSEVELAKMNMSKDDLATSVKESVMKNGLPYADGSGCCSPDEITVNVFLKKLKNEEKQNEDMKILAGLCFGKL